MSSNLRVPEELRTPEFLLRPIRAADAALDFDAVMESKDFLRGWEQTGWPEDDFTVEANRADLVRLEQRHQAGESFTYTVLTPALTQCLGCVYVMPTGAPLFAKAQISAVGDALWFDFDVAVYFWVRKSQLAGELDRRLLEQISLWLERDWRVRRHLVLTTETFEQQVGLLDSTGRTVRFELRYANKAGRELAYAYS